MRHKFDLKSNDEGRAEFEKELEDMVMYNKSMKLGLRDRRLIDGIKSKRLAREDDKEWDGLLEGTKRVDSASDPRVREL